MFKKTILLLSMFLVISSCKQNDNKNQQNSDVSSKQTVVTSPKNINEEDLTLLKNIASGAYKTDFNKPEAGKVYNTPDQIKILEVKNNFVILEYTASGCLEYDPSPAKALWYYNDNKWNDMNIAKILGYEDCPTMIKIQLIDIDNDGYLDVILNGGVGDDSNVAIFLNKNMSFSKVEIPVEKGDNRSINKIGTCGETVVSVYHYTESGDVKEKLLKFNCVTSSFE
ncbi:MAG: hypothetical protein KBH03_07900 [Paludibacteraceae bacterium]|nr:hypothetical protein [Paludibacteraceae bacterium]